MRHSLAVDRLKRRDEGQMSILLVLLVLLCLIIFLGFGEDMTNLFFHRQMTQQAADATCVAAAMDLLTEQIQGPKACLDSAGAAYACGRFVPGTALDCASATNVAPCQYAVANGFSSPGLTPAMESNDVTISFPASVPGVVTPDSTIAPTPFVQVEVYDRVRVYFSSMLSGVRTQDVHALAKCGLQQVQGAVPMIILDPTDPATFSVTGTPNVQIIGGPIRSIQVNSNNTVAVNIQGSASVDLTRGGPNFTGSDFGVFGGPSRAPGGFSTNPPAAWQSPAAPVADPFATVSAPPDPKVAGKSTSVGFGVNGCPDPGGCTEYSAGDYTGIDIKNSTAIFDPGVYYIGTSGLNLDSNSIVRPSTATGDGSMGTVFFMTCSTPGACQKSGVGGTSVASNSGKKGPSTCPAPAGQFQCYATLNAVCPGTGGGLPTGGNPPVPNFVGQNVLVGPCTTNGWYDVPASTTGPIRGMVLYSDRSGVGSDDFSGGGGLLLIGTLYVHDCPNSPACVPPTPGKGSTGDYKSSLALGGNSGEGTEVVGFIVSDTLNMHGTPTIDMFLKSSNFKGVLKAALLR